MAEKPFGFPKDIAKDLRDLVRGSGDGATKITNNQEQRRVAIAKMPGGGIPARSGSTPGTATITLCQIDGTNGIVTTSVQETGYNIDCTSIPENEYAMVIREYIGGKWIVSMPITDLRLDGSNLQYRRGCSWTTWTTGTDCAP